MICGASLCGPVWALGLLCVRRECTARNRRRYAVVSVFRSCSAPHELLKLVTAAVLPLTGWAPASRA